MIEQRASAKGLSVRIEADSLPERLFGDAERLSQALLNYAANAVKFTEAGSITLKARTIEDGESSCLVRIEVVDTGIGIAPEARAHIRVFPAGRRLQFPAFWWNRSGAGHYP
jgi:signal transduction histidine kinase